MITERSWSLPPLLAWTDMLFKGTEWAADEKVGHSCCCFCFFADAVAFRRCYLWTCVMLIVLCCFGTHKVVFQEVYRIMSSSFKCFIFLRCCPNLFLVWVCSISSATSGNVRVLRVYRVQIQFRHDYFLHLQLFWFCMLLGSKSQIYLISPYMHSCVASHLSSDRKKDGIYLWAFIHYENPIKMFQWAVKLNRANPCLGGGPQTHRTENVLL